MNYDPHAYIRYHERDAAVQLDGCYDADDLRAIVNELETIAVEREVGDEG